MKQRTRMDVEQRKRMILYNATALAHEKGLAFISFEEVAKKCPIKTSENTVRHYFKHLSDLQAAVCANDHVLTTQAREIGLIE